MDRLAIEPYHSKYQSDFEILNREWIEEYFKMEQEDLNILQNPEEYVIKKRWRSFFFSPRWQSGRYSSYGPD